MSARYKFKQLSLSNLPEIMAIERVSSTSPWSAQMMKDSLAAAHVRSWGIFAGAGCDELVGYVLFSVIVDEAEVLLIAIRPEYRRQGLGKALLRKGLEDTELLGVKMIYLEVRKGNALAHCLYESLGFQSIGIRSNYYRNPHTGESEDAVLMRLTVTEGFSKK
jgi:ribosomal-protein-alanine N-acetyltransferase